MEIEKGGGSLMQTQFFAIIFFFFLFQWSEFKIQDSMQFWTESLQDKDTRTQKIAAGRKCIAQTSAGIQAQRCSR